MDKYISSFEKQLKQEGFKSQFIKIVPFQRRRDGAVPLASWLKKSMKPRSIGTRPEQQRFWELCAFFYRDLGRYHEAINLINGLYEQLLRSQELTNSFIPKGMPLVWISQWHKDLNHPVVAKRYLMLTACEDAIRDKGKIPAETTGAYFRLVWLSGMPQRELNRYAKDFWKIFQDNKKKGRFPECLLQQIDQEWMTEYPSSEEVTQYVINFDYVRHLVKRLKERDGIALEYLAHYLLGSMPGCRAQLRMRHKYTEYDVVCSLEGPNLDFRGELGRYFLCECKNWEKPVDFTAFAKFCRVLDAAKCKFGILFSKNGITGEGRTLFSEREQLKMFQDRGIIIVVITKKDLDRIVNGANFLALLRKKYEAVRLDLQ